MVVFAWISAGTGPCWLCGMWWGDNIAFAGCRWQVSCCGRAAA